MAVQRWQIGEDGFEGLCGGRALLRGYDDRSVNRVRGILKENSKHSQGTKKGRM